MDALLLTYANPQFAPAGATVANAWVPDAATRAAGQSARVPYRYADQTGPGEQREPFPAVHALHDVIVPAWPGVYSGGMRRDAARIGTTNHDPHKSGIAIDFMVRDDPNRVANGTSLATFLARNSEALQIQYIIWNGTELSTSNIGPRWEPYTGAEGHTDHVHVEIGPVAQAWTYDEMASRLRAALAASGETASPWRNAALVGAGGAAALAVAWAAGVFR